MERNNNKETARREAKDDRRGPMHFDYKNVELLSEFINPHARMHSRRRTGFTGSEQRSFAAAIKRARFMALMPYISR